ncbi:MAG TPA: SPFH domain-containing protein [Candidatus Paceibacterota bacterium]|nr:SPFH domain-containing protein [Candidatus Paceibacterota bacterium]
MKIPGMVFILLTGLLTLFIASVLMAAVPESATFFDQPINNLNQYVSAVFFAYSAIFGIRKIDVAFKGSFLFLGMRIGVILNEGWTWMLPPIYSFQTVDMKDMAHKLDNLEGITKDNVKVSIDESIIWKVIDPNKFLNVGEGVIRIGFDDTIDQVLREEVRGVVLDDAIGMRFKHGAKTKLETAVHEMSKEWGVKVTHVRVPAIMPDAEVLKSLELKRQEIAQREAEKVEIKNVRDRITDLKRTGLSPVQAAEVVQTERKKVVKTIAEHTFRVDDETSGAVKAVAQAFQGRRGNADSGIVGALSAIAQMFGNQNRGNQGRRNRGQSNQQQRQGGSS